MPDSKSSPSLVAIVLTFNSAGVIERTVSAAQKLASTVICVDSGSTDGTIALLEQLRVEIRSRPFTNYADQRNWAIDTLGSRFDWQFHVDADEVLDDDALREIRSVLSGPRLHSAYLIRRRTYFMGQPLRYGGTVSWHLRLFKSGEARCENRLYDQHFVSTKIPGRLAAGWMHDLNLSSLTEWTARHNRWSDLESTQIERRGDSDGLLAARLSSDPRERTRLLKGGYYQLPLLWRAAFYFAYRYILRAGFLDGKVGFIYCVLQALWFRVLVDAKIIEAKTAQQTPVFVDEPRRRSQ